MRAGAVLSIYPATQAWQRAELAAWQESAEDFYLSAGAFGAAAVCALLIIGVLSGLIEWAATGGSPAAGGYIFAGGCAGVALLLLHASFGEVALEIYTGQTVY